MPRLASLILALATCAGTLGCADTIAGSSAMLKTDLPQSLVGAFDDIHELATGDLDGDGAGDLIVAETRGSDGEIPRDLADPVVYTSPPRKVYVYYGRAGGFGTHLSPQDADAVFTLEVGERVHHLTATDLDGDGAAELTLFASLSYWFDPHPGSVYVLPGGARFGGSQTLSSVANRTDAHVPTLAGPSAPHPRDFDGQPGLEFLLHATDRPGFDTDRVEVRDLYDGTLRATLVPRPRERLTVLEALDVDADGFVDIVCRYAIATVDGSDLEEQGIGTFYGPLASDRSLGDLRTESATGSEYAHTGVVGNFVGDDHDDLLFISNDEILVLTGGPRAPSEGLAEALVPVDPLSAYLEEPSDSGPSVDDALDLDDDGVDEVVAVVAGRVLLANTGGDALHELELSYRDDQPVTSHFGATLTDMDGDGALDLVLGTFGAGNRETLVHVVYGFGGG